MDNQAVIQTKPKEGISLPLQEKEKTTPELKDISEYFSDSVFKLIKKAAYFARRQGSSELSHWYLLNSLLDEKPLPVEISEDSLNKLNQSVKEKIQSNNEYKGVVFFSKELKQVLLASYIISRQQYSNNVDVKHVLLALSVFPGMDEIFSAVNFSMDENSGFYMPKSMSQYAFDLTGISSNVRKYPERKNDLENVMRILARENKHNVVLVGEEGVGKSVIGTVLANFLISNQFPNFEGVRVLSLDVGNLFPMTSDNNSDIRSIVEGVVSLGKIIFFLDNVNLLSNELQISRLVDFLKILEKKGNVFFVVPTVPSFYKEFISNNSYFSSNFESVQIDELSQTSAEDVVQAETPRIEKYYKLKIEQPVCKEVVALSKRYLPGSLPLKAITLLEEVCAGVSLKNRTIVTVNDVRDVVSQKTGIPLNSLTQSEAEKLKNLESLLEKYVIGQKEAVTKVSESLRRARAGLKDQKKPIGSFLFLGPTGVGKTELAKTLAKLFFNDEKAFIRFDMSEYAESHTAQRLIGSPPGYVGYEEGGQLTNQVLAKPYSLLLFDEIEKAHPRVFDLFLQILDDGRLTDSQGRLVDFRNTLIIFTSNIASQEIFVNGGNLLDQNFDRKKFFESTIMPIVRQYFRPEFVNRFDDIVMFNPLGEKELVEIAKIKIKQLQEKLNDKKIKFVISDEKLEELVKSSFNPSFGARPIERAIKDQIENPLAQKIVSGDVKEGDEIKW